MIVFEQNNISRIEYINESTLCFDLIIDLHSTVKVHKLGEARGNYVYFPLCNAINNAAPRGTCDSSGSVTKIVCSYT